MLRAESARHDHMPLAFDDVAIGKARAVFRRHESGQIKREADLAAMGVARERQRHPGPAPAGKCPARAPAGSTGSSVLTCASVPGRSSTPRKRPGRAMGELIAEPGEPEATPAMAEQDRVVLQERNADAGKRARARRRYRATNRDCRGSPRLPSGACRRASSAAQTGSGMRSMAKSVASDIVAQHHNDVLISVRLRYRRRCAELAAAAYPGRRHADRR